MAGKEERAAPPKTQRKGQTCIDVPLRQVLGTARVGMRVLVGHRRRRGIWYKTFPLDRGERSYATRKGWGRRHQGRRSQLGRCGSRRINGWGEADWKWICSDQTRGTGGRTTRDIPRRYMPPWLTVKPTPRFVHPTETQFVQRQGSW